MEMNWNVELLGNPLLSWLTAIAVAVGINAVVGVVKWVIISRLSKFASQTATHLDDAAIEIAKATRQWLVIFVSLYVALQYLELAPRLEGAFRIAATIAAFLQLGLWANSGFRCWIELYRERAMKANIGAATSIGAMAFIGQVVLWSVVLLLGLDNLGVDVTALIAGLGVGGIAVALAVQNILGDLFASLSIVIDKPFVVGDFIIVDTFAGTVEYVGLKTTRIRSLGGEQIVFANSDLLQARVRNYKRMWERRILFNFGVLYQTTADQLEKIPVLVKAIIEQQPLARFDRAHFAKFGDSSLDYEVVYWMQDPDYTKYMDTQQAINLALVREFEAHGIGFAYPTRTLFVEGPIQVQNAAAADEGEGEDRPGREESKPVRAQPGR
jgi:small-conductance mechanosensitive channel